MRTRDVEIGSAPTAGKLGPVPLDIARAAARLFASRGYDATSVREICEEAGVTKPTLYYHFGSKEGLAQALLTVPLAQVIAALRASQDDAAFADPILGLERMLDTHFAFFRDEQDLARFYFSLCFGPLAGSPLAAELGKFGEAMTALFGEAVARLESAGLVAPGRLVECVDACRGLVTITAMDHLFKGSALHPQLASRLVGDLLWGFGKAGRLGRGS